MEIDGGWLVIRKNRVIMAFINAMGKERRRKK